MNRVSRVTMRRWLIGAGLLASVHGGCMAAENMSFRGALVAEPCTLRPGDEDIRLDIGSVIDKHLYTHGRTPGQSFRLELQDCDLSLGNRVRITFAGAESAALPGLLRPDAGSKATGIALGLETTTGAPLALNKPSANYALVKGSNSVQLQVYIRGEPAAIAKKTIGLGAFSAVATFGLEYE